MKTKEKIKKKQNNLNLDFIWRINLGFRAEGNKLRAEGNKLWAEGDKLWAEGSKLWAEAILEVYGNIRIEWKNWNKEKNNYECHLETGEIFRP